MADTRDWKDVWSSCAATIFFSFCAYCHYGSIIHQSTWDRQHLYLPLLFLLFPEIFLCQIFINTILVIQRYRCMRRLQVHRNAEGFWIHICSVLNLHSKRRDFELYRVSIAGAGGSHEQQSEGMWRLSTLNSSRLSYYNKYQTDFDGGKYSVQLGVTLLLLYQGISACITYINRSVGVENGTLGMDHLTGTYAMCGTMLELTTLVIIVQPYEWLDNNVYNEDERCAMPDVDTSNAWVYEGFLAVAIHGLIWVSLRSWIFLSTLPQLSDPLHPLKHSAASLFIDTFSAAGVAISVLVCVVGFPLMIPTIGEVIFKPSRSGMVWLARWTGMSYYTGGVTFRLILAVISLAVALVIWIHAAGELLAVEKGQMKSWNTAWKTPNPGAKTLQGMFLGLWTS